MIRWEVARLHLIRCCLPPGSWRNAVKRRLHELLYGAATPPMLPAPDTQDRR